MKSRILEKVVAGVLVAAIVGIGGWWLKNHFDPPDDGDGTANQPAPDFEAGSERVYSARFDQWPAINAPAGLITVGLGNEYVLQPAGNDWLSPGHPMEITRLNEDFVLDLNFRIDRMGPMAAVAVELLAPGPDSDCISVELDVPYGRIATYSISKGRRRPESFAGPRLILEGQIAEYEPLPSAIAGHNWSSGSQVTLKREAGRMQLFVNGGFVREFLVPVFPVAEVGVLVRGPSTIVVTSLEARIKHEQHSDKDRSMYPREAEAEEAPE